jgi:catechol 2,3-dioxygenase-like lactoylglutathione lyase family enzyme
MRLRAVTLQAPADRLDELATFYTDTLGLEGHATSASLATRIGWTELNFGAIVDPAQDGAAPFYHFAFLVPGDRMEEALEWAIVRARLGLLALSEDPADLVMEFEGWQAHSCYFHDPASNIVELIAHDGFGENGRTDAFSPSELLGISEIGLIGNPPGVAAALSERLGLSVFQGSVEGMAFIGEPTAALILAEEEWRWLPQGRPAEAWPATVQVSEVPGGGWAAAGIHQVDIVDD